MVRCSGFTATRVSRKTRPRTKPTRASSSGTKPVINAHAPGFYIHLATDGIFYGGGVWTPPGPQLNLIRDYIADNARSWARIANAKKVKEVGGIRGDSLKRPPRGFDAQHVHIEDLKRKSFYVMTEAPPREALKPEFIDSVTEGFRRAMPLNRFITGALDLPF